MKRLTSLFVVFATIFALGSVPVLSAQTPAESTTATQSTSQTDLKNVEKRVRGEFNRKLKTTNDRIDSEVKKTESLNNRVTDIVSTTRALAKDQKSSAERASISEKKNDIRFYGLIAGCILLFILTAISFLRRSLDENILAQDLTAPTPVLSLKEPEPPSFPESTQSPVENDGTHTISQPIEGGLDPGATKLMNLFSQNNNVESIPFVLSMPGTDLRINCTARCDIVNKKTKLLVQIEKDNIWVEWDQRRQRGAYILGLQKLKK